MARKDKIELRLGPMGVRVGLSMGRFGVMGGGSIPRRFRVDPRSKREEYIRRLEEVMVTCNLIMSSPAGYEKLQVQAMDCLIRAVRACYRMVEDVEVEILEQQVEELKQREKELGFIGYKLPDSTG